MQVFEEPALRSTTLEQIASISNNLALLANVDILAWDIFVVVVVVCNIFYVLLY